MRDSLQDPQGSNREASLLRRLTLWSVLLVWLALGCQVLFGDVTVKRSGTSGAACTVGEYRCTGEYLLACDSADTGWSLKKTCGSGALCDAKGKACAVCKDGDTRCNGAERQQCAPDGASWKLLEPCPAENLCSESSCDGCVTDGQLDCSVGSLLRRCSGGKWMILDDCGTQAICQATTAYAGTSTDWNQKCVSPGCDKPGTYRCQGSVLQRCPPERDAWTTVDTCANPDLCQAAATTTDQNAVATLDMCKPVCMNPGAFECDGLTVTQCRPNQTGYDVIKTCQADQECDPTAGDCGQLCTPGRFQCNGASLRKCGNDGHWLAGTKCETAALCSVSPDGATGSCIPSPCGTLDFTCSGVKLQKCRDDRTAYDDYRTCISAALCDAPSARCIEPTCMQPNVYQCFGQDLKQCSDDQTHWIPIKTCDAGQYCDASTASHGCSTECPANPVRCNGKVMERCTTNSGWTAQATCATADLCNCAITDPDGEGPKTNKCALGLFTDGCGNAVCGGSKAQFQCQGAELQQCQAGRNGWDPMATCGANNLCYPGEAPTYTNGYCLTCPTAGEQSCSPDPSTANVLRVCSADRRTWGTVTTCSTLGCITATNANDYCAVCAAGSAQCAGATLQTCSADLSKWNSKACASAALCDKTHQQCDVCNQTTCTGKVLNKCSSDGQAVASQTCFSFCDAPNQRCNTCTPSSVWCDPDTARLNTCSADGQTITGVQCISAGLCESKNSGNENICHQAVCTPPGGRRCNGTALQVCRADQTNWDPLDACATAALCDPTRAACNPPTCAVGQKRCNGAQPEICNANRNGWVASGPACDSSALCKLSADAMTVTCNQKMCNAGDKKCMGTQPMICKADLTDFTPNGAVCPVLCNAATGTCGVCTPDSTTCSGTQPKVCSADGSGYVNKGTVTCATAALCIASTGTCKDPTCAVGQHLCSGTNSQVCNSDRTAYVNGVECGAAGCNATTNACNTCTPGSFQCSGLTLQQCSASGTWSAGTACPVACDETKGANGCDICTPNSFQCTGSGKKTLQQCNAAGTAWSAGTACAVICDAAGGQCDECMAGDFQCSSNVLQQCSSSGMWATKQDCGDVTTAVCNPAGSCDAVAPPPNSGGSGGASAGP